MQPDHPVIESIRTLPLQAESVIWVAFSGGLDSTVLLHACVRELSASCCKAIHINHGIDSNSNDWAQHCREVCDEWGVTLDIEAAELSHGNVELQARLARYRQFECRLKRKDIVVTAHHADDVAETRLWQFLTGRAVVGIAEQKTLGRGHAIRPFLHLYKHQLRSYGEAHSLSWIEDPSNADTTFDRNWIRHRLLPDIEQRFPDVRVRLAELAPPNLPQIEKGPLDLSNTRIDEALVRAWLLEYGVNPPNSAVKEIVRQSSARLDSSPMVEVTPEETVRRYRDSLYLVTTFPVADPHEIVSGQDMEFINGYLNWETSERGFVSGLTLELRNRTHSKSQRLAIRANGMSKSLTSLFQENGVAPWLRDGWPILMKQERVVCIPGIAIADEVRNSSKNELLSIPIWKPKQN